MNTKQPDWDDAASRILTVLIPLLLKAGRDNGVSLTEMGAFRKNIVHELSKDRLVLFLGNQDVGLKCRMALVKWKFHR